MTLERLITKSMIYAMILHALTTWFSVGEILLTATIAAAAGFIMIGWFEKHEED